MISPEVEGYRQRSDEYWRQATELLDRGQIEKASELAWGSVVEKVKALALVRGRLPLKSHRDVRDYVKRVARQTGDKDLWEVFRQAEKLHVNFYEGIFDRDDVREDLVNVRQLLMKIDALIRA